MTSLDWVRLLGSLAIMCLGVALAIVCVVWYRSEKRYAQSVRDRIAATAEHKRRQVELFDREVALWDKVWKEYEERFKEWT